MTEFEKLLTDKETEAILGFPPKTMAQMRIKGQGPDCIRMGRRVRYRLSAIDAWVKQSTCSPRDSGAAK